MTSVLHCSVLLLVIALYICRDVHLVDNDSAAGLRTSEVGVKIIKAFGKYPTFYFIARGNKLLLSRLTPKALFCPVLRDFRKSSALWEVPRFARLSF